MHKRILFVAIVGCAAGTKSTPTTPEAKPIGAAPAGGASYGGTPYGGSPYGGAMYGGAMYGGAMYGGFGVGGAGFGPGTGTPNSKVPSIAVGQPDAKGDLDAAIIRRYIKRNIQKLQYCYEKELVGNAKLKGTVNAEFTIAPDGTVNKSTASGVDANVSSCVAGVIQAIVFPAPKGGGSVTVKYPFVFQPAGG